LALPVSLLQETPSRKREPPPLQKEINLFCTKEDLLTFDPKIAPYADRILEQAVKYGLINELRMAHFLAQIAHESTHFTRTEENLNYSANGLMKTWPTRFDRVQAEEYARQPEKIANFVYANRMGNRGPESGDGYKYRGRGLIQCTGKDNYDGASQFLYRDDRLLSNPNLLSKGEGAVDSAFWFWDFKYLNKMADQDDIVAITRKINGGTTGLNDRLYNLKRAKEALRSK
jgi:putative chitinase